MTTPTPEAFLAMLAKSQLLTPERLDEARDATLLTNDIEQLTQILIDQGLITGWQTSQLLTGRTSFFIGNYVLLDLLGSGGMGSVYLARHTTMNRYAAIKVISKKVGKDPDSLPRFIAEARATASLDHPNIVRAYDVDSEADRFYIVMEYVPGNNLEEIVELDGPLDFVFIVDCVRQAADGLAHAHGRNMIHCDIKPSNLLVNDQDVVKILDMGMARLVRKEERNEDDSSIRRNERLLGTVDYMAPEQAMQGPDFDHRADIYSLGCTLYFLLTGRPPFGDGTLTQRILQHQTKEPTDIRQLRSDAPPELVEICRKMMAKNPADRYQTAAEVSRVLGAWRPASPAQMLPAEAATPKKHAAESSLAATLEGEGVGKPKDPYPAFLKKKKKSVFEDERKLVLVMAVATVIAGLLALVIFLVSILSSDSSPDLARGDAETENPVEGPVQGGTPTVVPSTAETGVTKPSDAKKPDVVPSDGKKDAPKPTPVEPPKTSETKKTSAQPDQPPEGEAKPRSRPFSGRNRPTIRPSRLPDLSLQSIFRT